MNRRRFALVIILCISVFTIIQNNAIAESVKSFGYEHCNQAINIPYTIENATLLKIESDPDSSTVILSIDSDEKQSGSLNITLPLFLVRQPWQIYEMVFDVEDLFVLVDGEFPRTYSITSEDEDHIRVSIQFKKGTDDIQILGGNPTMRIPSWAYTNILPDKYWIDPSDKITLSIGVIPRIQQYGDTITVYAKHYVEGTELFRRTLRLEEFTSDGNLQLPINLPSNTKPGMYSILATVPALDDCGDLTEETLRVNSPAFIVRGPAFFPVATVNGKEILVHMSTNSTTYGISLGLERKTLSMVGITGELGTFGQTKLFIPHEVLDGEIDVTLDGNKTDFGMAQNSTHSIITVNYPHTNNERRIEVTGTTVIPEFPFALMVFIGAFVVAFVAFMRIRNLGLSL